jgi:hypothetical protein
MNRHLDRLTGHGKTSVGRTKLGPSFQLQKMFGIHFTMHCLPMQPDLDWKTRYKKLLGSAPLLIAIPGWADRQTGHEREGRGRQLG